MLDHQKCAQFIILLYGHLLGNIEITKDITFRRL